MGIRWVPGSELDLLDNPSWCHGVSTHVTAIDLVLSTSRDQLSGHGTTVVARP
jgi:hypothetical protein